MTTDEPNNTNKTDKPKADETAPSTPDVISPDNVDTSGLSLDDNPAPITAEPIKAEPITAEPIGSKEKTEEDKDGIEKLDTGLELEPPPPPPPPPSQPIDNSAVTPPVAPAPPPTAATQSEQPPPIKEPDPIAVAAAPAEERLDALDKQRLNEDKARKIAEAQQKLKDQQQAEQAEQNAETEPQGFHIKEGKHLDYVIEGQPDYARVTIDVPANKTIMAERSAMIAMDTNMAMKTKFKGGFKRFLTSESLFLNEFTAEHMPGSITLANGLPGDIKHYHMDGTNPVIYLQGGAFLASTGNIKCNAKWQGMVKGFFSGAGMFLIQIEGQGDVFFNSYGGIMEIDVTDEFIIDTNHIVAFTGGLDYKVEKFGGYKSFFFSGEGLVARFRGTGKIWVQTRNFNALAAFVRPFRPSKG